MQDACGQLLDLFGHGGAEHQVLALCGQLCNDLLHVMHKAHVQHPVGLVQHKDLEVRQVDMALSDEVVQTAQRPGQAMRMSTPFRMASTCGAWPTPPKMTVLRSLRYLP
mgnify:CR=1 FL=1